MAQYIKYCKRSRHKRPTTNYAISKCDYKCHMFYYILPVLVFSIIECIEPDLWSSSDDESHFNNISVGDVGPLFEENETLWNLGDIPLLNKKIFKGMRVTIREHPYVASVRRDIVHYLTATMLTKNLFITVAHPLIDVPIDELTVVVGENYADRGATLLNVMLVIIHEDFDPYTLVADLALLRVYEDTPYRCSVKSIQLVHPKATLSGHRAFVTGWGRCDRTGRELCLPRSSKYTAGEKFDPMLRSVSFLMSIPNFYCDGYRRNGVILHSGMVCAGHSREEDKVSPCIAVPGAPLVVQSHLAAIQSWGFGCGYDHDLPLVYTSIQHYQPWLLYNIPIIRRIVKENLTILFEAKRACLLTKWLNLTRIVSPRPYSISNRHMELLRLDRELAKLKGLIFDIRDYLFDGIHHEYKMKLYEKLREKYFKAVPKEQQTKVTTVLVPFLNPIEKENLTEVNENNDDFSKINNLE